MEWKMRNNEIFHKMGFIEIEGIKPYPFNARIHSEDQIKLLMDSIKEFGFTNPLIVDCEGNLIAGHGRLEAVKRLNKVDFKENKILKLPCIEVSGLSDTQKKALVIADNRIAELAGWDFDLLRQELEDLENSNFNIELTGFDQSALNEMGGELENFYSDKVVSPVYEIKGEKVEIDELVNSEKANAFLEKIEKSGLNDKEKEFLRFASYRFLDFHFEKIAEFYAGASVEMKEIMEELALIIIDYDKALELGYVKLQENIENEIK